MDEHQRDRLGREGVSCIERHKDEPFFLHLGFHGPLSPIQTIEQRTADQPQAQPL